MTSNVLTRLVDLAANFGALMMALVPRLPTRAELLSDPHLHSSDSYLPAESTALASRATSQEDYRHSMMTHPLLSC